MDEELSVFEKEWDAQPSPSAPVKKADAAAPSAPQTAAASAAKPKDKDNETQPNDPLQKELDDAAAAATAAGIQPAKPAGETQANELEDAPEEHEKLTKWIASLQPPVQKYIARLQKQRSQQFQLTPTHESPLAHVENEEQLNAEQKHWQTVAHETRRLLREGTLDGGGEITLANGSRHKFESLDQIEQALSRAEHTLDEVPTWRERLLARRGSAPWQQAERIAPGLFEAGTPAHTSALEMLRAAPQIKAKFPDYEVRLAHYARSVQMESDEAPTADFPFGKAKYVRLELDREGRYVQPKVKREIPVNTKPLQQSAPVHAVPGPSRPAMAPAARAGADKLQQALAIAEKSGKQEDLDEVYRALEAAA